MTGDSATLAEIACAATTAALIERRQGLPTLALLHAAGHDNTTQAGPALARLAQGLQLDPAEVALLLLLLAHGLSEDVARDVATIAPASGGRGLPLWLAQQLIPDLTPLHIAENAALRRFALIAREDGVVRVEALLRLDDAMVDRFIGHPPRDRDVSPRFTPCPIDPERADDRLTTELRHGFAERGANGLSCAIIVERDEPVRIAASIAALGLRASLLHADAIPADAAERDRLARLWSREAMLDSVVLVIIAGREQSRQVGAFAERVLGHVVVCGPIGAGDMMRPVRFVPARTQGGASLTDRWALALGPDRTARLGRHLGRIATQFHLDPAEIDAVCTRTAAAIDSATDAAAAAAALWHAAGRTAQAVSVPGVSIMEPVYGWDDIVLAPPVEATLRRLEAHVRHATTVMDDWGFAARMGGRGRGVAALLSGPSGTGKTMAAEVLASALDLRMMVIDLSQIISKYVGETSKNIATCFHHAERSGAVMVWNEGDVIWGARGNVGNATDRHVNAEIGDLLQRIEGFRGFTVVTTNLRHAVDPAFLRRFRFMIDFPLPTEAERVRLWQKAFPREAPVDPLDWSALAGLPLSGGSIRNVALASAFLAAEAGSRIKAGLIAAELAEEMRKQDRPMPVLDWGRVQ